MLGTGWVAQRFSAEGGSWPPKLQPRPRRARDPFDPQAISPSTAALATQQSCRFGLPTTFRSP
jgi:hypothetical protein